MPDSSDHLRFAVLAADLVPLALRDGKLLVRLIRVNRPPHFDGIPGLPGGLLLPTETAEEAARRHLAAKAGITAGHAHIEQLYTFSRIDRDPRGRVVAVAYLALVAWETLSGAERADSDAVWWAPVEAATNLAYDHDEVLAMALSRLKSRITYTTLISRLLPPSFTLTELEEAYETILGTGLDKRNFRKKVLKLGILSPLNEKRVGGRSRPAQLYSFASKHVRTIEVI